VPSAWPTARPRTGMAAGGLRARVAGERVQAVACTRANATVATAFNSRVTDNIVRAGLNYKFDTLAGIWADD